MTAPNVSIAKLRAAAGAAGAAVALGTQPRPTDKAGRELDEYGLPYSGPARQRALAKRGLPDPNIDPAAWKAGAQTENNNG